jgi:hypothetical protein
MCCVAPEKLKKEGFRPAVPVAVWAGHLVGVWCGMIMQPGLLR